MGGLKEKELKTERGFFTKSNDEDMNDEVVFQFFYLIVCGINKQFYESNTQIQHRFYPNQIEINMQISLAK